MDEELNNRADAEIEYLESLESQLLFVDCAGVPARTSKLFTNQTYSPLRYIQEWTKLIQVIQKIGVVNHELVNKFSHKMIQEAFAGEPGKYDQINFDSKALENLFPNHNELLYGMWEGFLDKEKEIIKKKFLEIHGRKLDEKLLSRKTHGTFHRFLSAFTSLAPEDPGICILSGEPGFGKSIAMKQACLQLVQQEILKLERSVRTDVKYSPILPRFFEAKKLSNQLISTNNFDITKNTTELWESINDYKPLSIFDDIEGPLNENISYDFDIYCDGYYYHNSVYFIDAYDECSENEKKILAVLINALNTYGETVVVSTRTNDVEDLYKNIRYDDGLEDKKRSYDGESPDVILNLVFDKSDLQETMPKMLAIAWGIDELSYEEKVSQTVDSYQKVLTHPVFVGLFCRLLQDNDLPDMMEVHLIDEGFAGYTVRHVKFYEIVIEKAIEHAVRKRHKNLKRKKLQKFTEAFYRIAWHNEFSELTEISKVIDYVSLRYEYLFDEQDKKILRDDMGLVYARGTEVSWVHRTLKEVAIGTLLAAEEVFSDHLKRTQFSGRRRMKDLHSFAVLTYCVQRITPTDDSLIRTLVSTLVDLGNAASKAIIDNVGGKQPVFKSLKKNHEYSLFEDLDPVWRKIAEIYIQQGKHNGRATNFTLPPLVFEKLSPRGLAVLVNDFQPIYASRVVAEHLAFPNMLPKDFFWVYHENGARPNMNFVMDWYLSAVRRNKVPRNAKFTNAWREFLRSTAIEHLNRIVDIRRRGRPHFRPSLRFFAKDVKEEEIHTDRELIQLTLEVFSKNNVSELIEIFRGEYLDFSTPEDTVISSTMMFGRVLNFLYELSDFADGRGTLLTDRYPEVMSKISPQNKMKFVSWYLLYVDRYEFDERRFYRHRNSNIESPEAEHSTQLFDLLTQKRCTHCEQVTDLKLVNRSRSVQIKDWKWVCVEHLSVYNPER